MTREITPFDTEKTLNTHLVVEAAAIAIAGAIQDAPAEMRSTLVDELQEKVSEAGLAVTDEELAASEATALSRQPRGSFSKRTRSEIVEEVLTIQAGGISHFEAGIRAQRAKRVREQRLAARRRYTK